MHLSPKELDKLVLHQACSVAQKRYARGLKLNYPECMALIAGVLLEWIRDGESVTTLMQRGKEILGMDDVMDGVSEMIAEVQVEGTFPDGSKLVTIHQPICQESGLEKWALYGSGLMRTKNTRQTLLEACKNPGQISVDEGTIILNAGKNEIKLQVINTGDRPVQVGSHYPFFEVNAMLKFDRKKSYGYRLNIPAGTAVRFEAGDKKEIRLVPLSGDRIVYGGNSLISGALTGDSRVIDNQVDSAIHQGFLHKEE